MKCLVVKRSDRILQFFNQSNPAIGKSKVGKVNPNIKKFVMSKSKKRGRGDELISKVSEMNLELIKSNMAVEVILELGFGIRKELDTEIDINFKLGMKALRVAVVEVMSDAEKAFFGTQFEIYRQDGTKIKASILKESTFVPPSVIIIRKADYSK
jgi:hypothetical protein